MGSSHTLLPACCGQAGLLQHRGGNRAPADAALVVSRHQEKESDKGEQGAVFWSPAPTQGFSSVFLLLAFHLYSQ